MSRADHFEWRYLSGGVVKHALRSAEQAVALCGAAPWLSRYWYGTGSQQECETLQALRPGMRCASRGAA